MDSQRQMLRELLEAADRFRGTPIVDGWHLHLQQTQAKSILQDWVMALGLRHQGVLLTAVRGCDTAPKNDPSFMLARAYRAVICHCAESVDADELQRRFTAFRNNLDYYPHHYVAHVMHACEIVGYKHPDSSVRDSWINFYVELCRGLHVNCEFEAQLDARLDADEATFGK